MNMPMSQILDRMTTNDRLKQLNGEAKKGLLEKTIAEASRYANAGFVEGVEDQIKIISDIFPDVDVTALQRITQIAYENAARNYIRLALQDLHLASKPFYGDGLNARQHLERQLILAEESLDIARMYA